LELLLEAGRVSLQVHKYHWE